MFDRLWGFGMVTIDRLLVGEGGFDLDFRIIRNRWHKPAPTNPYRQMCEWGFDRSYLWSIETKYPFYLQGLSSAQKQYSSTRSFAITDRQDQSNANYRNRPSVWFGYLLGNWPNPIDIIYDAQFVGKISW
jgi:hypothetical protein